MNPVNPDVQPASSGAPAIPRPRWPRSASRCPLHTLRHSLCDAPSGAEHRYQGDPGLVGTCQARHHRALYACRHQDHPGDHEPARSHATSKLKEGVEPPAWTRVVSRRPSLEVADIFRGHGPTWRWANAGHVSLGQLKVMSAIENSPHGGARRTCRALRAGARTARSRTIVAATGTARSARARRQRTGWRRARPMWLCCRCRIIHVVFTLPAAVADIAYQNKAVIYDLLFKASAETLITIAADPRHFGARIGITSVLHTWGSAMTHHPHVHMIVAGRRHLARWRALGGVPPRLLPAGAACWSRLFRRLFLERLLSAAHQAGRLEVLRRSYCSRRSGRRSRLTRRGCAEPNGSSMPSAVRGSAGHRRCWPICRGTPTALPSPTAA